MPASKKELKSFIATIARMTQDGEDVNGEEFVMENDDAVSTVNRLIQEARALLEFKNESEDEVEAEEARDRRRGVYGPEYKGEKF